MQAEGIIAAVVGLLGGGAGRHLTANLFRSERERKLAKYYNEVIEGLERENRGLRKRMAGLETRQLQLEEAIAKVTLGELPPEFS